MYQDSYLPADNTANTVKQVNLTPGEQAVLDQINNKQNTPEWTTVMSQFDTLFSTLVKYATPLIERVVEKKFNELLDSSLALAKLDNDLDTRIEHLSSKVAQAVCEEMITSHCDEYSHADSDAGFITKGEAEDIAEEAAKAALYDHTNDYDHDDYDNMDSKIEDQVDDKVTEALDNYDFAHSIKEALNEQTFILRTA